MSAFDDFIGTALAAASAILGTQSLTAGEISAPCVAGPATMTKALRDSGLFEKVARTVTLKRADFDTLQIGNRSPVTLGGLAMKVMLIEDDGECPMVTLHLQKQN